MTYLHKEQLLIAYNNGLLDDVADQILKYGDIISDHSCYLPIGVYADQKRVLEVRHHQLVWTIHKRKGQVVSVGFK